MEIFSLYDDYGVPYKTSGKHSTKGWVNVDCPYCEGSKNGHLGYNIDGNFFVCFRCGWHPIGPTIARLLHLPEPEVRGIIKQYGILIPSLRKESIVKVGRKPMHLPSETGPLGLNHKKYLIKRGFDPEQLEHDWGIVGTGPYSRLDNMDYKHRIVIPFIWNTEQVSFDSRDITDKHPYKYMACPAERERISHKDILYGKQSEWTDTAIVVEGPTDVWRFGVHAIAASGIKYTPRQVRVIAKNFKKVWVVFDSNEIQALIQAKQLVADLKFRGVRAATAFLTSGDPGRCPQEYANKFVNNLLTSNWL